ncbi:MAG: HDOD domain-containing protein [Candidatus Polarisedimenticolaceae bacterium]|nr:HDOD domain-containing protein [Candidatus Polarisedimenticolaceae bacterium]
MKKKIGRFKVIKKLGEGHQGTVFLCQDEALQRQVAIKLLDKSDRSSKHQQRAFLSEARSMSKNQHANIVSIYEVGKEANVPYLVCEYVEGVVLSEKLRDGPMAMPQLLDIIQGVLEGINQAHQNGIVHGDLKPSNIIISDDGTCAKVMDFGVAKILSGDQKSEMQRTGSPCYMAPEYIQDGTVGREMDVFALGLILSEMLTGEPVFSGRDRQAIEPPSGINSKVDEQLDRIVLKALESDPSTRYPTAEEMLTAMKSFRQGEESVDEASQSVATLDFLLRRMRRKSDFPALSSSVRNLNAITMVSDKDLNQISSVIVKDFSLANKILQVVNSAFYGRFSGTIGTVSRAVVVLGVKSVRSLAASLIFFEHMQNQAHAKRLRGLISRALFTAVLAKELSVDDDEAEEYFLAGMLHELGKLLVAFYLPGESEDIEHLITQKSMPAAKAVHQVLGASYEAIGEGIAKQWNFPTTLTDSMRKVELKPNMKSVTGELHKQVAVSCANEMSNVISESGADAPNELKALFQTYGEGLGLDKKQFDEVMKRSVKEYVDLVEVLVPGNNNTFLQKLTRTMLPESKHEEQELAGSREVSGDSAILAGSSIAEVVKAEEAQSATDTDDAERMLTEGLQDVTGMLVDGEGVSQICNVVLETLYRAMGFQRIVLSLRSGDGKQIVARMGFGDDIDTFIKCFHFPVAYSPDIFHVAMKNVVDIYIADSGEEKIKKSIPDWYSTCSSAGSFLIFPLVVKKKPLGLIYADHPDANGLHVDSKRLNLIKALRNQIVLAFQSH